MPYEIILKGRVQGVGCRYYCEKVGRNLGLHGAATNCGDGSVKVILDTDSQDKARDYADALTLNRFNHDFYGRIQSATVHTFYGEVRGECVW
jgi:acylphosphatase